MHKEINALKKILEINCLGAEARKLQTKRKIVDKKMDGFWVSIHSTLDSHFLRIRKKSAINNLLTPESLKSCNRAYL